MKRLASVLPTSFNSNPTAFLRPSGEHGRIPPSGGTQNASALNGTTSPITGTAATLSAEVASETGPQHGALIADATPRTAAEAEALAQSLVTHLLPQPLQVWLTAMEYHRMVSPSVGGVAPAAPERTPELVATVSRLVTSLSSVLTPARERGLELEAEVLKMFAAFNIYLADQGKVNAMTAVWCEQLQEFPLYAIRKACRWTIRGCQKLPSIAAFIADVRLAVGSDVLQRRMMLVEWMKN